MEVQQSICVWVASLLLKTAPALPPPEFKRCKFWQDHVISQSKFVHLHTIDNRKPP